MLTENINTVCQRADVKNKNNLCLILYAKNQNAKECKHDQSSNQHTESHEM